MHWNLVRLMLIARALSRWRRVAAIAAAEPGWLLLVVVALCGGGAAIMLHLAPHRQSVALGATASMLTVLLAAGQRDERLHRIIGVSPRLVHVVEALLWSFPLTLLAALHSLRDGAVIAGVIAATAVLSADMGWRSASSRSRRRRSVMPTALPEWTVGICRTTPIILIALLGGMMGSGSPGPVLLAVTVICLTTSAYFWKPAEGWLLIHSSEKSATRFLSHKVLASLGVLAAFVFPLVLLGAVRTPEYQLVYWLSLAACLHVHAAAVLVKYAAYREGQPLDATGTLIWFLTAVAITVPPIGLALLLWQHRRATARIADYCAVSSMVPHMPPERTSSVSR